MLPAELCLDANVFVSALLPQEAGYEVSSKLLSLAETEQTVFLEPAVVLYEVVATLRRKAFLKELTPEQSRKAIDLFLELPLLLQWQPNFLQEANRLSEARSLKTVNDCTYLAVALAKGVPLITWDKGLLDHGKSLSRKVHDPESFLEDLA